MSKKFIVICVLVIIITVILRLMPSYFYSQGKHNYDKQNYEKAYNYLKKSYNIDKKNQDYRYYYVHTMLKLKPDKSIQEDMFKISTDTLNDSAHQAAQNQVSKWKYNVLKNIGNNYIEQVPSNSKILRWSKFPVKYTIINNSGSNIPDYYFNVVKRAFSQWHSSTKFLKFEESQNDAQIIIEYKKLPDNVCEGNVCRFVLGFTTPEFSGKHLKKMNIILYDKNPVGNFFSENELYNTVLHEIGHALGIMGHSYNENDLMHMSAEQTNIYTQYRSSFQYLSQQDINTITLLYKLIPDITNSDNINTEGLVYAPIILGTSEDISKRKLKEAQNYIKKAPDLAGGYIDLGVAYVELGKNNEAIEAMQKAYDLAKNDTEKYLSLFNLSLIYMNNGNMQKAKEYALKAQQISDTEDIRNLILNFR